MYIKTGVRDQASGIQKKMHSKVKTQKINRPLNTFWIDNSLLSPDISQRVTCNILNINMLKSEKTWITGQNAGNGFFGKLSGGKQWKEVFGRTTPTFGHPSLKKEGGEWLAREFDGMKLIVNCLR